MQRTSVLGETACSSPPRSERLQKVTSYEDALPPSEVCPAAPAATTREPAAKRCNVSSQPSPGAAEKARVRERLDVLAMNLSAASIREFLRWLQAPR